MCKLPECDVPVAERIVRSIDGAAKKQVGLIRCPNCDTRRCDSCGNQVTAARARVCPSCGFDLFQEPKLRFTDEAT